MPWTYEQSTGRLLFNGQPVALGYSGNGQGVNNPEMENRRNIGPIPKGRWKISRPYDSKSKGKHVMALTPDGHDALKRTAFMIHGDNSKHNKSASNGCIILGPAYRKVITSSGDNELIVTE